MDAETLAALKGSIKKWEEIVCHDGADKGTRNCPLCLRFISRFGTGRCDGCPVANAVQQDGCKGTPYIEWDLAVWAFKRDDLRAIDAPEIAYTDELAQLAYEELQFLISLLPKEDAIK